MSGHEILIPYRPMVELKFRDESLPYDASATDVLRRRVARRSDVFDRFPGLRLEPALRSKTPDDIQRMVAKAEGNDPEYERPAFFSYFVVPVPNGVDPEELARGFAELDDIEYARVASPPGELPHVRPDDDPKSVDQRYLNAAPEGIDARYAWSHEGGDGNGIELIDVERGWVTDHKDLVDRQITVFSGQSREWFRHGTAILGIVGAVDNAIGCVGIVPRIKKIRCASEWRESGAFNTPDAITDAVDALSAGDVLLLEIQAAQYTGYLNAPSEIIELVFHAVRLGVAHGICVVAAAGNGSYDLDTLSIGSWRTFLNRNSKYFRDSGAILVGGGTPATRARTTRSNYGSRIDCFAWGQGVMTTDTDDLGQVVDAYGNQGGTSTAAAIVAGAAVAVQGVAQQRYGRRFKPKALRALLSDASNTPSENPTVDRIGVMPNLKRIIDNMPSL